MIPHIGSLTPTLSRKGRGRQPSHFTLRVPHLCHHPAHSVGTLLDKEGKKPYYPPPCTRLARVSIVETTLGSLEVDALGQSVREPGANVLGEGHKRRTGERVP